MQRYAWSWTGDNESTWGALRQTIPTALGLSLCGIPYTGPDIGGFGGDPSAELFLRWFQMASFLPFFRGHADAATKRREPWLFGEPYTSIIQKYLILRYQLMPYIYTLAWETSQSGLPLVRPLFWEAENDPNLSDVQDAFTLGDALLVAPVMEQGARQRDVILPPGEWVHFWDENAYQGPNRFTMDAPLERIPLLVRTGTVLPMETEKALHLHIYPPSKTARRSSNDLYSDSGDGYGEWRLDRFYLYWEGDQLKLQWEVHGEYPFPYQKIILNIHTMQAGSAWVDGRAYPIVQNQVETQPFQQVQFKIESEK
jgi:alpha-glucosidase